MLVKFVGVFPIYGDKHRIFLLKSINKVNDINKFFTHLSVHSWHKTYLAMVNYFLNVILELDII